MPGGNVEGENVPGGNVQQGNVPGGNVPVSSVAPMESTPVESAPRGLAPAEAASGAPPDPGRVAARAYEIYQARGGGHGRALDDWLQAERELWEGDAGQRGRSQ